jgi:glycosyltransferase involved in cell wall biosynthesis
VNIALVNLAPDGAQAGRWSEWAADALAGRGHDVLLAVSADSETAGSEAERRCRLEVIPPRKEPALALRKLLGDVEAVLCCSPADVPDVMLARPEGSSQAVVLRWTGSAAGHGAAVQSWYERRLTGILATRHSLVAELAANESWALGKPCAVVYDPVLNWQPPDPEEVFGWRVRLDLTEHDLVFLSVGPLVVERGFEYLVAAFEKVIETNPNARLAIIGEGPQGDRLRRLAAGLGEGRSVAVAGAAREPRPLLEMAAVVVEVGAPGHDPFQPATAEALMFGRPVIAADQGEWAALIENGAEGLLVTPGNLDALTAAMTRLAGDPALLQRMAVAAARKGQDLLLPDRAVESLEAFLEEMRQTGESA